MNDRAARQVVIVGAGPAGIRAAEVLVAAGLHPVVIDEAPRAGGQIYRRPPPGFTRPARKLYGPEAAKALALHALFDDLVAQGRIVHHAGASVMAIAGRRLLVLAGDRRLEVPFDRLIIATGASDRLAAVPGWQQGGVYSLGGVQIALKAQGVTMGRRLVLAGSGPLLTLVASQLLAAGAGIAAVLDTSTMRDQMAGLPGLLARPMLVLRGAWMRARLGRLYHAGVTLERIAAGTEGPAAVLWQDSAGRGHRTGCDMVGIGWHLRSESHLADLAGCTFAWSDQWSQWLVEADDVGRAGEGIYVAGDGFRPLGADAAEVSGRLAAGACLGDLGLPAPPQAGDLRRLKRLKRFAAGLARAFPWPEASVRALDDDTVVCRCEGIRAGDLRENVQRAGPDLNRIKALGRCGMGRCQGRYCQASAAEIVAVQAGLAPQDVGRLRAQAPVRPAPIGAWKA